MKRIAIATLSTAALVAGITGATQLAAHADPSSPATPAVTSSRSTGLDLEALKKQPEVTKVTTFGSVPMTKRGSLAGGADLSRYAIAVGDQGRTNSCVAFATGWSAYGILMNQANRTGAPMHPMFLYSQINDGRDEGTTGARAMPFLQKYGIDTKSHYRKGLYDWRSQPTDEEWENALNYRIQGYQKLPTRGQSAKRAIQEALDNGYPIAIGMQLHQNFQDMDAATAANYTYEPEGGVTGGHETTIVGYNDKGVKVLNSWGSGWGARGYYTLPWDFVNWGDLMEAHAMGPIEGAGIKGAKSSNHA